MTHDQSSKYSIFVYSENKPPNRSLDRFKTSLFRALEANSCELMMFPRQEVLESSVLVPARGRLVVFCEDVHALKSARKGFSNNPGCVFALIVIPTSRSGWGAYTDVWAKGLAQNVDVDTIILTDSDLSRRVIESELKHFRADVRVLGPAHFSNAINDIDESGDNIWRFEKSKFQHELKSLNYSGMSWEFEEFRSSDSMQGPTGKGEQTNALPSAASESANSAVISEILVPGKLSGDPIEIGILGTKLTFIDELSRDLARNSASRIILDEWEHLSAPPDVAHSTKILENSDVIIGEWARPNNFWIQEKAKKDKRLIVRAHRYEVTVDFPRKIDMDRYFGGVVIVPWVGRALVQNFGWPSEKMVYIPNYVNSRYFHRPKLEGSEFTLGIVGITPDLKRLDLAIDLLERLRRDDLRYVLRVRGNLPSEHINWHKQPMQAEQWGSVLHRIESNPLLRNAVHFDQPGRDMASWYQQIGVILSTSDLEGSHVALAEGIASGALPIARRWPGIETLWPDEFIFDDLETAARSILEARNHQVREQRVSAFQGLKCLDQDRVLQAWWDLINGRIEEAQQAFGPVDWEAPLYEKIVF
ncbi:glycosyltransferase family protein [Glutamicibacter bergerei]